MSISTSNNESGGADASGATAPAAGNWEEHKKTGNDLFQKKQYAPAIDAFSKAIQAAEESKTDVTNTVRECLLWCKQLVRCRIRWVAWG